MFTIAFIGGDGAGKTTLTDRLRADFPLPLKYLYMGMSTRSSNYSLPTSKVAHFLKLYFYKKSNRVQSKEVSQFYEENRGPDKRGKIGAAARLLNRMAEECYRQVISWNYQYRGNIVLYDRHFIFDFAPKANDTNPLKDRFTERFHRWFLNHIYPQPDMSFFLDAPPEVLYARKGEASIEYLQAKRETYLNQGKKMTNFYRIDATQTPDEVYEEVVQHIMHFYSAKKTKSALPQKEIRRKGVLSQ